MKWKIEEIKSLKRRTIKGEEYIKLNEVIKLLSATCTECKHFSVEDIPHPITGRINKRYVCKSPMHAINRNMERGWRYTNQRAAACTRFEERMVEDDLKEEKKK